MANMFTKAAKWLGVVPAPEDEYYEDGYHEYEEGSDSSTSMRATATVTKPKVGGVHSITSLHPRSYNDARSIGDAFRNGVTTVINVSQLSEQEARRIIDFASGLVFGLHGAIERVDSRVFILSPAHIDILSDSAVSSGASTEFFNQS